MMAMEGYIRKRPDADWWTQQIQQGEQWRKKVAYEDKWKTWRAFYRGEWQPNVMPVNLFFTLLRTTVPRIYFRNPGVSVTASKPGLLNMTFARILERVDNKLMRQMRMKRQMKRVVQNGFLFGTGVGKMGFGAFFAPVPLEADEMALGPQGQRVEYTDFVEPDMPWFSSVRPGNFVVPAGLEDWEQGRWVAEKCIRPVEDIRNDPRFENTKSIKSHKTEITDMGGITRSVHVAELYEIHDRKTGKVFILAPSQERNKTTKSDKIILFDDDMFQNYGGGGFNYFPLIFNEDDERFWGIPDSQILEPYQLDINETRTQIMKHRRLTLVKLLVKKEGMDQADAERMVSEDVAAVAWVKGDPNTTVRQMQTSDIPPDLFRAIEQTMQDVRETVGFSRNEFGEFNSRSGDTTATEARIVKMASEIRVDERRDLAADMLSDIIHHTHGIIFDNWGAEEVVDVVGPGGVPVWVQFRGDLLRTGRYTVNIDPDTALPETRQLREQRAIQLYQVLKTNPLMDPIKLTQYLLHEMRGSQFDDMMRMLPTPEGGVPNGPVPPEQFAQLVGNSLNQVGRPGQQKRLNPPANAA